MAQPAVERHIKTRTKLLRTTPLLTTSSTNSNLHHSKGFRCTRAKSSITVVSQHSSNQSTSRTNHLPNNRELL